MKRITGEEDPKRGERKGLSTALPPLMEAVTENGGDREVLTAGVLSETGRGGSVTERDGRATAETGKEKETEAESKGKGVKTGWKAGVQEAETEEGDTPVHPIHLIAQVLITWPMQPKKRRTRKNKGR